MNRHTIQRNSPRNKGRAFYTPLLALCLLGLLQWSCSQEPSFEGQIVNLYGGVGRSNNYEHLPQSAIKRFGSELLQGRDSSATLATPLCIGRGIVYLATTDGKIVCMSYDQLRWEYSLGGALVAANMCVDAQGNIYAISNKNNFLSLDAQGKQRFSVNIASTASTVAYCDLLCLNDGVICTAHDGTMIKYAFDGKEIWRYRSVYQPMRVFAGDEQANIALALSSNILSGSDSLVIVGNDGRMRWGIAFERTRITTNVSWHKGKLYLGGVRELERSSVPVLHCVNDGGQIVWSKELSETPRHISLSDTAVYVAGVSNALGEARSVVSAHSADAGTQYWELYYQAAIVTPLILSKESLTFVATQQNKAVGVYRMNREGVYQSLLSMSDAPLFYLQPGVAPDGSLVFGCREHLGTLSLSESAFGKILPF